VSSCWTDVGWRLDRYNGTFATGRCTGLADRLGTVFGTVGVQQLSKPSNSLAISIR
jgi:hypothetical protein